MNYPPKRRFETLTPAEILQIEEYHRQEEKRARRAYFIREVTFVIAVTYVMVCLQIGVQGVVENRLLGLALGIVLAIHLLAVALRWHREGRL